MATPKYIEQALVRVLDGSLHASGQKDTDDAYWVEIRMRNRVVHFDAVDIGAGRPSDVRHLVENQTDDWPAHRVAVAQELSPASIDALEAAGINWADETGRAHIVAPDVIVVREIATARPQRRQAFSWSPSATAVAEAVLSRSWPNGIRTGLLAKSAGWSPSQVSEVLQGFDEAGWTRKAGGQRGPTSRRDLVDPEGLLDNWAREVGRVDPKRRLAHRASLDDILGFFRSELSEALNEHVRWAASGWAASELLAPIMTSVPTLQIYVAEEDFYGGLTKAITAADLREVNEGGRVEFWAAPAIVFELASDRDDIPVVSPARAYVDLVRMGGRAEEAADHVRDEVILPLHRAFSVTPPSQALLRWEAESLDRLRAQVSRTDVDPYSHGTWSVSYRLADLRTRPSLPKLRDALRDAEGRETGWPVWLQLTRSDAQPKVVDGTIECWLGMNEGPGHADYWRASPDGLLFLLRGFQEDGDMPRVEPGTALDLTLPVWRVGECLLHAKRMAAELGAQRVEVLARWTGLEGRNLSAIANPERFMPPGRASATDVVSSSLTVRADAIDDLLPDLVRTLVEPLFDVFDFFRPPQALYEQELARMQERVR